MTSSEISVAPKPDSSEERALRYKLLSVASRLLPEERVQNCSKYLIAGKEAVTIKRNPADGKAWFDGVQHCSSIWNCPVCANRITEFRRKELTDALKDEKYDVIMVTYTLRHNRGDKLSVLLEALKKAYKATKSGRFYQSLQDEFGIVGSIRTIEVTWSDDNGWHVHIHELLVFERAILDRKSPYFFSQTMRLRTWLKRRWEHCLKQQKRDASWERGVDVNAERDVSVTYVAKQRIAQELTRSVNKKSRGKHGITPFGMLAKIYQGEKQYEPLFQEYAAQFKGTRQLFWSHGLKELLGVNDVADSEITEEMVQEPTTEAFEDIAVLEWLHWKTVYKHDLRGELLKVASTDGRHGVYEFLLSIGVDIGLSMWARGTPIESGDNTE